MNHKRRSEKYSTRFVSGQVEGWVFGVGEFFRMQLDIRLDERMDTEANIEKKKRLGRSLLPVEKVKRRVWTQGVPPAFSFDRGQVFHEVGESKEGLRRSIVILLARPDPGALVETQITDETGAEKTIFAETEEDSSKEGFVDYEVLSYRYGVLIVGEDKRPIKEQSSRTQTGFAELLRTGN